MICLTCTEPGQFAAGNIKGYIGGNIGQASINTGVTGLTGTASLDEDDLGWKVYGGVSINEYIALEVQYADFGEAALSGATGDGFTVNNTAFTFQTSSQFVVDSESIGFSAVAGYDINEYIRPFVRVGGHQWDSSASVSTGQLSDTDTDGFDVFWGVGLKVKIYEQISGVVEYEQYTFDNDDVDLITAGIQISF